MKPEEVIELLKIQREDCSGSVLREDDIDLAIEALEKQMPKKPIIKGRKYWFVCGACDEEIDSDYEYCPDCGTKIDWSKE